MKKLLGCALAVSVLTLVLTPDLEAGWRNRRRRYSTPVTTQTAQAASGYRTYSYEPGSSGNSARSTRPVDRSFRDATFKASGRQN